MAKHRLGKGLADLGISELLSEMGEASQLKQAELRKLPLDLIEPGKSQPRQEMDADKLQDLANSIKAQGVIQPIVVRSAGGGGYEIVAGERRWRAAQLAELKEIPAVVREISDEAAVAVALIENIQRENLNAIEEAEALQRLIAEFDMTHQGVADSVGKSRAAVSNMLRLLCLRSEVKAMLGKRDLDMGHARALLGLEGAMQLRAADAIVAKGLSVRETELLVKKMKSPSQNKSSVDVDPNITKLQQEISEKLGAKVFVKHSVSGKGQLVVHYNTLQELDGIVDKIS